jgi:hypothetical protein
MVKDLKAHKMKRRMNSNERIYVRSFPGATVEDLEDHVKPTMRHSPDLIVLHAGTNNLRSEMPAKRIAENIMKLALEIKSDTNDVMLSSLICRSDDVNLNQKLLDVNRHLQEECNRYSLVFINNNNIDASKHLNGGGLHLNFDGTLALSRNLLDSIKI